MDIIRWLNHEEEIPMPRWALFAITIWAISGVIDLLFWIGEKIL